MKRQLGKQFGKLLAALLALAMLLPCAAMAAPGDANLAREEDIRKEYGDYIRGACVQGDTLYLNGGSHLFSYHIGDADLTAMEYETPEDGENEYRNQEAMFSDGEQLYALVSTTRYDGKSNSVVRMEICPVDVSGEKAKLGEGTEVNIDELTTTYDSDNVYLVQINDACCVGGYLFLNVYDDSGRQNVYAMDMATGEGGYIEGLDVDRMLGICAYEDGQLLIETFDYTTRTAEFCAYDPASETVTSVGAPIEMGDYSYGLPNFIYSQESGKIFYRSDGYVMAMENFDYANAQEVAELSSIYSDDKAGLLLPGDYYVSVNYDNTAIRNTDPGQMAETRLIVQSGFSDSVMDAYYAFGNSHGDVAVVLDSDYQDGNQIVEAMMNRDDSVDIYMQPVNSQAYDALFNRDYMLELTEPKVVEAVGKMYPFIQDVCTKNGAVVAVPISIYGWSTSLDVEGFKLIGISEEELPTNWKDLLDFLPTLADKIPEGENIYVFDEYNDQRSIRYQLYSALLDAWRTRQDAMGEIQSYDDPDLISMMEAVRDLDLGALGVPEPQDNESGAVGYSVSYGGETHNLVQFSIGATIGNFYAGFCPTPLAVLPGEQAWIPQQVQVAFVNPFSKHPDLAQEFLATILDNLDEYATYNLSDELNEPVRNEDILETIEEWKEELEKQKEELETADEIEKPAIEENIKGLEDILANQERYMWRISAEEIEWYRNHAQSMTVQRFDFMYSDDDGSEEIYELTSQLYDGKIDPADFVKQVDRKVRMRAMEGN